MKKYLIIIALLFVTSLISIYVYSAYQYEHFNIIGITLLFLAIGSSIIMIIKTTNRVHLYIVLIIALNILLTYISMNEILHWEDISYTILMTSFVLLGYTVAFFGFRKYTNIIFAISLTISFTMYSYTGFLHFNEYSQGYRLYGGIDNKLVLINILIGIISVGLLLLLSKIKNRYISRYSQLILQVITVVVMWNVLYWIFYYDA